MKKILIIISIIILISVGLFFCFNKTQPDTIEYTEQEDTIEKQADSLLLADVPFIVQAPLANWNNPVFQDACEEAAILMIKYWLQGKEISKQEAYNEIIILADFEEKNYGNFYDHSAEDTAQIMRDYIGYQNIEVKYDIDVEDIKTELKKGNLVIVPINGQAIGNPYYTSPGPERHMLVIIDYDSRDKEFITNDSGTKRGKDYHYNENILYQAVRDYPTGHKAPIVGVSKAMIVIKPKI